MSQRVKKHWTQTAKGRKLLSINIRKYHAKKKRAAKKSAKVRELPYKNTEVKNGPQIGSIEEAHAEKIAYAFGHCEAWLQTFAERHELPFKSFARRVGQLLQYAESR